MKNIIKGVKKYSKTDRVALICEEDILTYKDLDKYSDLIANYILGKYDEKIAVVIYANKERLILPCMIGALKSGRAYVPMDTSFPEQRVRDILSSVKPNILFNFSDEDFFFNEDGSIRDEFKDIEIIDRKRLENFIESNLNGELSREVAQEKWVDGDENSYILFTSGSTGKPKGVEISTYNLDSFINWMSPILGLDGSEKIVMDQPAYSFDLSVSQLYPGITNGATLYSFPKKIVADFKSLFMEMKKSNMEVWVSTPSFAGMCLADREFNENLLPKLRKMLFIGEVLPVEVAKKLYERFPNIEVINGYGPTEATVGVSHVVIEEKHINSGESLPVGVPMPNCTIKILDEDGNEVEAGEKGEISIIGPSVSKGYYKNEEKTRISFYIDKSANIEKKDERFDEDLNNLRFRAYRTGDIGMMLPDGNIKYSGRKDFQIKLHGYRIEIEDIENNLRKLENIKNAVVLPIYKNEKIAYLKGFVELEEENGKSNLKNQIAIKKQLAELIPEYMVPRNIRVVSSFPMNTNGKIDRKKLSEEV